MKVRDGRVTRKGWRSGLQRNVPSILVHSLEPQDTCGLWIGTSKPQLLGASLSLSNRFGDQIKLVSLVKLFNPLFFEQTSTKTYFTINLCKDK